MVFMKSERKMCFTQAIKTHERQLSVSLNFVILLSFTSFPSVTTNFGIIAEGAI